MSCYMHPINGGILAFMLMWRMWRVTRWMTPLEQDLLIFPKAPEGNSRLLWGSCCSI